MLEIVLRYFIELTCAGLVSYLALSFKQIKSLKKGIQALLRAQMISDYNKWKDKGYAPIYARENFENVWCQYHIMGVNGVMDDIHAKFLELPTDPPEEGD